MFNARMVFTCDGPACAITTLLGDGGLWLFFSSLLEKHLMILQSGRTFL